MDTWAQDLEPGSLVLLQDDAECTAEFGNNHGRGLSCLEAKAHLRLVDRTDFEWLLVVDDDTFVFAKRLRATLQTMDAEKPEVYGIPGCGKCGGGRTGLCGGGGYVISRQNLRKMVHLAGDLERPVTEEHKAQFLRHFMHKPDDEWCDVRFACVAQDTGLALVKVNGLYGWAVDPRDERKIVELQLESPPLVMHYITNPTHMNQIESEFRWEQRHDGGKTSSYAAADWRASLLAQGPHRAEFLRELRRYRGEADAEADAR